MRRWNNLFLMLAHRQQSCFNVSSLSTILFKCWPTVFDVGPTLKQHCSSVSCLLGIYYWFHTDARRWTNAVLILGQPRKRCASIETALVWGFLLFLWEEHGGVILLWFVLGFTLLIYSGLHSCCTLIIVGFTLTVVNDFRRFLSQFTTNLSQFTTN